MLKDSLFFDKCHDLNDPQTIKNMNDFQILEETMLAIFLGISIGGLIPTQTAINARLRQYVISPFVSSFISFTVGTLFLLTLSIFTGSQILLTGEQMETIPWWAYLGGVLGTIALTANILLFPILGSVQTVIIPIIGQIVTSVIIDHFGLFGAAKEPLTVISCVGILLLVIGVVSVIVIPNYINRSKLPNIENKTVQNKWMWQLLGLITGIAIALQVAVNGQLGVHLQSSIHAGLISCAGGASILLITILCQRSYKNIMLLTKEKTPLYTYIGGILGASYIFINASLVPQIGAGTVVVLVLLGQILVSLCIEHFGLFGAYVQRISNIKIIGVVLMVIGIYLIKM